MFCPIIKCVDVLESRIYGNAVIPGNYIRKILAVCSLIKCLKHGRKIYAVRLFSF